LRDKIKTEYRYYGETLDNIGLKDLEYLMVLGAFLAVEQIEKSASLTESNLLIERYHLKHNPPEVVEKIIAKYFPLIKVEDEPDEADTSWHQDNYELGHPEAQP
jgi:hypothetical protein